MERKAYFAGGCFWCMEKPYHTRLGVLTAESGYSGGIEQDPVYADVKAQKTSHRETVEVTYDDTATTFSDLLDVYFDTVDPFDGGGQFIDRGRSYTCAIFYTDEEQQKEALLRIARIEEQFGKKVCVAVEPFTVFYPAEEEHRDYARKNPEAYAHELEVSGRNRAR